MKSRKEDVVYGGQSQSWDGSYRKANRWQLPCELCLPTLIVSKSLARAKRLLVCREKVLQNSLLIAESPIHDIVVILAIVARGRTGAQPCVSLLARDTVRSMSLWRILDFILVVHCVAVHQHVLNRPGMLLRDKKSSSELSPA